MLMTIRNEDPARAFARLRAMKASVGRTGEAASFDWFVLSDSTDPEIAAREEAAFAEMARWRATRRASITAAAPTIAATRPAISATSASVGATLTNS